MPCEVPFFKQLLILQIQAAHRAGLRFMLVLRAQYGGPVNVRGVPEELWPVFLPEWDKIVVEYARLAERYGVELFAPMHEGDGVVAGTILRDEGSFRGIDKASEWGQSILARIREVYRGKVVWRTGLTGHGPEGNSSGGEWETVRDHAYIEFRGYDYLSFTIRPDWTLNWEHGDPESEAAYRRWLNEVIDYALGCARRDGCEGVIVTETGDETVFEEGQGRLSGYFWSFAEPDRVAYWYRERLR